MRIHTSLTRDQIVDLMTQVGRETDHKVTYASLSEHGSRTHDRAFEVRLAGSGTVGGGYSTDRETQGATWDEWGVFLAHLFDRDPSARCGSATLPTYDGRDDFHRITGWRFDDLTMPADTHKRHAWVFVSSWHFECRRCSAVLNRNS